MKKHNACSLGKACKTCRIIEYRGKQRIKEIIKMNKKTKGEKMKSTKKNESKEAIIEKQKVPLKDKTPKQKRNMALASLGTLGGLGIGLGMSVLGYHNNQANAKIVQVQDDNVQLKEDKTKLIVEKDKQDQAAEKIKQEHERGILLKDATITADEIRYDNEIKKVKKQLKSSNKLIVDFTKESKNLEGINVKSNAKIKKLQNEKDELIEEMLSTIETTAKYIVKLESEKKSLQESIEHYEGQLILAQEIIVKSDHIEKELEDEIEKRIKNYKKQIFYKDNYINNLLDTIISLRAEIDKLNVLTSDYHEMVLWISNRNTQLEQGNIAHIQILEKQNTINSNLVQELKLKQNKLIQEIVRLKKLNIDNKNKNNDFIDNLNQSIWEMELEIKELQKRITSLNNEYRDHFRTINALNKIKHELEIKNQELIKRIDNQNNDIRQLREFIDYQNTENIRLKVKIVLDQLPMIKIVEPEKSYNWELFNKNHKDILKLFTAKEIEFLKHNIRFISVYNKTIEGHQRIIISLRKQDKKLIRDIPFHYNQMYKDAKDIHLGILKDLKKLRLLKALDKIPQSKDENAILKDENAILKDENATLKLKAMENKSKLEKSTKDLIEQVIKLGKQAKAIKELQDDASDKSERDAQTIEKVKDLQTQIDTLINKWRYNLKREEASWLGVEGTDTLARWAWQDMKELKELVESLKVELDIELQPEAPSKEEGSG